MIKTGTVVIGAGMAGITVAAGLAQAGARVAVFDKARGLGGRLATRRVEEGPVFDHGSPWLVPEGAAFGAFLGRMAEQGAAARWEVEGAEAAWVGQKGMSGVLAPAAQRLQIRFETEIASAWHVDSEWTLKGTDGKTVAQSDKLAIAIPAPQAARLLAGHAAAAELTRVTFASCWTLMAEFETAPDLPDLRRDADGDLVWIAREGSKPGRERAQSWVAHAGRVWSRRHLEESRETVTPKLLELLQDAAGGRLPKARYLAAHRWRYAHARASLGRPCIDDPATDLVVAGDFCADAGAEGAFESGRAALAALERMGAFEA